jgi:hypothetical protein
MQDPRVIKLVEKSLMSTTNTGIAGRGTHPTASPLKLVISRYSPEQKDTGCKEMDERNPKEEVCKAGELRPWAQGEWRY